MVFQHISEEDTIAIAQQDSEFESISNMGSPALSSFSSVPDLHDDGKDESALPDLARGDNIDGGGKPEPLSPLDSFVPIIETLPGLALEDNTYHVDAPLLSSDLNELISYAQRVEELRLTDASCDQYPKVSQDTIARLAMAQDPKKPFLSFLKHLKLVDADSELAYLWFCITPSLETLQITGIPQSRHITISAFFKELVRSVPQLASISLYGRLSANALQSSVQFTHLRQLQIIDAAASINFAFLQAVSALPGLETFLIDVCTAEYTPYTPAVATSMEPMTMPNGPSNGDPLLVEDTLQLPACVASQPAPAPFPQLTDLTIVSNVLLMSDLLHHLFPGGIERVSLTLVREGFLLIPEQWCVPSFERLTNDSDVPVTPAVEEEVIAEVPLFEPFDVEEENVENYHDVLYHTFTFKSGNRREGRVCRGDRALDDSYICNECMEIKIRRLQEMEALAKRRLKEEEEQRREVEMRQLASNALFQTDHFAWAIEQIVEHGNPRVIHINRLDNTSSPVNSNSTALRDPLEFPPTTLGKLLSCPSLVRLEIEDWTLVSVNETFLDLPSSPESPFSLQMLFFPIEASLNSGVVLSTLSSISRNYPSLLKFQSRVVLPTQLHPLDLVGDALVSHDLTELAVGGGSPIAMEDKLQIAPYLSFLFPQLEKIAVHDGEDAEDWKFIHELVRMCQKVETNVRRRLRVHGGA